MLSFIIGFISALALVGAYNVYSFYKDLAEEDHCCEDW